MILGKIIIYIFSNPVDRKKNKADR